MVDRAISLYRFLQEICRGGLIAATLLACGCSDQAPNPPPPRENAEAQESAGQTVTGRAPKAIGRFPSVVILEPQTTESFPAPTESPLMDQYGMQFHPGLLLVREGQSVEFRNSEEELHNVHVVDPDTGNTLFNVGIPPGGSYAHRFERSGAYDVSCHIHPAMAAFIVVTSTPYAVIADNDGHFSLSDVPPGSYKLEVWNVDEAQRMERVVEIQDRHTELILAEP